MIGNKFQILDYLKDKEWLFTCKEYKPKRTLEQNARYWAILNFISKETWNDDEYLHSLMKKQFLSKRKQVKIGKKKFWVMDTVSTTKLNTKQFSDYNEKVENFFREFWISIPQHDTKEFLNLIETYSNKYN